MWTLCYFMVVLLVGAAARSSVHYPHLPWLTSQESLQPETEGLSNDDVPILNSGMNIHESRTEANDLTVNDETNKSGEKYEQWFSTKPAGLEEKKVDADTASETANNEEIDDEINVQVNVDTAAEVSTEIRRPQIIYRNGKIERNGKLIIKINVKTNKDEPKPIDGFKYLFYKGQNDYDQETCDWLNELKSRVVSNNPRGQLRFNQQQESQGPQGVLRPQRTLPQHALGAQGVLRPQRTLPQHALIPQ